MALQSGVFVLKDDDSLVAMQPTHFDQEVDFQEMISKFPSLLVGDQINPDAPRRFVLVKAELPIGHEQQQTRWSLDHLFLDQDGVPTLVEVKRKSDPRIRREVVGQMLDYAANFQAFWSAEKILSALEASYAQKKVDWNSAFSEFIGPEMTADRFWQAVATNIRAGKLRLLFVADHIPSELRRIVEFLNEQMNPVEVLALELRQFSGQGLRTIVPVIFGQTQEAAGRKDPVKGERWTEDRLLAAFDENFSASEAQIARSIFDWMKSSGFPLVFGTGREYGSVYPMFKPKGVSINPAYLSTEGKLALQLKSLEGKPALGSIDERRELLDRFRKIDNSGLVDAALNGWGTPLSLSRIAADPRGIEKAISALDWIAERVRAAG